MRFHTVVTMLAMLPVMCGMSACASQTLQVPHITQAEIARERTNQYALLFESIRASSDYAKEQRLINITYPLLEAATALCPQNTTYHYGLITYDPTRLSSSGALAREHFMVDEGLSVLYVVESFHPDAALSAGDIITAVNGQSLAGMSIANAHERINEETAKGVPIQLALLRDGKAATATLPSREICKYPHEIKREETLNAYADGSKVYVTASMLDFAETDNELALVMAHEISHNILEHTRRGITQKLMGAIRGAVISGATGGGSGSSSYARSYEAEADYLGIYIMSRAGFDAGQAAPFWRRMAIENPDMLGNGFANTHPSTPERFVMIEKTLQDIEAKQAEGLPLLPTRKRDAAPSDTRHNH